MLAYLPLKTDHGQMAVLQDLAEYIAAGCADFEMAEIDTSAFDSLSATDRMTCMRLACRRANRCFEAGLYELHNVLIGDDKMGSCKETHRSNHFPAPTISRLSGLDKQVSSGEFWRA
jgi:hypothetical protein